MKPFIFAVLLVLLWSAAAMADEPAPGYLSGAWIPPQIGPVSGGLIYAFEVNAGPPPQRDRSLRLPDAFAVTGPDGKFSLELAEGAYYLSTRKQFHGDAPGPPEDGDLYGLIRDQSGRLMTYTVKSGAATDIGVVQQATVFKSRAAVLPAGATGITGMVKAADGSPLADAIVLVYDNPQIRSRPSFASHKTGPDGRYMVRVDREGTYFATVHAANSTGQLKNGDLFGVYGGEAPQPILVREHGITGGIDILVGQFVRKRPEDQTQ